MAEGDRRRMRSREARESTLTQYVSQPLGLFFQLVSVEEPQKVLIPYVEIDAERVLEFP